jgi:hypothetical protein
MAKDRGKVGHVSCRLRWLSFSCRLPLPWQGEDRAEPAYVIDAPAYVVDTGQSAALPAEGA